MTFSIPIVLCLVLLLFIRRRVKHWLAPPVFMTGYWFLLFIGHAVLGFDVFVDQRVPLLILTCFLLFYLSYSFYQPKPDTHPKLDTRQKFDGLIFLGVLGGFMCGFVASLYLIYQSRQGLAALTSPRIFAEMAAEFATLRYRGHSEPLIARTLMLGQYSSAILGGFLFSKVRNWRVKILGLLPIVSALMITAVLTTKASTLITLFMWFSAFLVYKQTQGGMKLNWKFLGILSGGLASLVGFFLITQFIRYEGTSLKDLLNVVEKMRLDFFSFMGPLSQWLPFFVADNNFQPGLGQYTFSGIFDALGIAKREAGLYTHSVFVSYGHPTNIYTIFRGFLQDFDLLGTFVFFAVLGGMTKHFSAKLERSPYFGGAYVALSIFYASVLWSHVTSLLNYNSILVALIGSAIVIHWQGILHKNSAN